MRTKGLVDIPEDAINNGKIHQINPVSNGERLIADPNCPLPDEMSDILRCGGAIVSLDFNDKFGAAIKHEVFPDKIIAENRSAHGVGFGKLVGRRPNKVSGSGEILRVAMKPFGNPEDATTEMVGYWTLMSVGVQTFEPVGIFPSANVPDIYVVLTQKRDNLQSLDRDDWIVGRQVRTEEDAQTAERNNRTVKEISSTLAWLHGHGIFHKDGQIKNCAVTNSGEVGIIDTENLVVLDLNDPDTVPFVIEDIEKLLKSLISDDKEGKVFGVGLLSGMTNEELRNCYEELILDPYKARIWTEFIDGNIPAEQAEMLIDGLTHHFEASKQDNWPAGLV